ncbi:hypothetical protein HF086_008302, partial [Spodoptera exigua]
MEETTPTVSLISCMHFVRRGVAKAVPEKIELTEKELEKIIKQTADDLRIAEAGEDESDEEGESSSAPREPPADPNDEFNFEKYDEEDNNKGKSTCSFNSAIQMYPTEGPDSDEEDDIIKPNDNLLLVGHVESDASVLEVYIYNKEEDSFYVHHDIILPWFPLCIEWLSHDPSDPNPGNLCALGGMDPVIQVWDLDIENCLEPAFKLASGSADNTVLLWDLDQGTPHTKIDCFQDKMSNNQGKVAYVDCRNDEPLWTIDAHEKEVTGLILSDRVPGLMVT